MTVETIKNIMRDVDPEVSEEELDRRATKVAKDSATIDAIEKALEDNKLKSIQVRTGACTDKFCIRLTYIDSANKWSKVNAIMNSFSDRVSKVSETKTTATYAIL